MLSKYTKIRIAIVVAIGVIATILFLFFHRDRTKDIADFDECVLGGYTVIDSVPRRCLDRNSVVHTEDVGTLVEMQSVIRIKTPERNTIMVSPILLDGEVNESWFTYGPVETMLIDEKGVTLGQSILEPQQKTAGTEFVRFSGKFDWGLQDPTSMKGTLIIRQRNAGGAKAPQEVRMPVFLQSQR